MSTTKQAIEKSVNRINETQNEITRIENEIKKLQQRKEVLKTRLWLEIKDHGELYQLINERPDLFEDEYE